MSSGLGSKIIKKCPGPQSCPWRQARCPCGRLLGPPSWASLIKVGVDFLSCLPVLPPRCPTSARSAVAKTKWPPDVDVGSWTGHLSPPPTRGLVACHVSCYSHFSSGRLRATSHRSLRPGRFSWPCPSSLSVFPTFRPVAASIYRIRGVKQKEQKVSPSVAGVLNLPGTLKFGSCVM